MQRRRNGSLAQGILRATQLTPLHAEGTAQFLNQSLGEIRVRGKIKVSMEQLCDRCLEPSNLHLDDGFDLLYMPAEETVMGERAIDRGAIDIGYYEGNGLDLNDILREVVLLAMPMQVICKEACLGICPVCGQNRNQRDCGCHMQATDERWSQLKSLRTGVNPRP